MIAEVWDKLRGAWNPNFGRPSNDWEIRDAQNFLSLISNRRVSMMEKDRLLWKVDKTYFAILEGYSGWKVPLNTI